MYSLLQLSAIVFASNIELIMKQDLELTSLVGVESHEAAAGFNLVALRVEGASSHI